jgi:hypothetical protein
LDHWLFEVMGITGIPTPYFAPNANGYASYCTSSLRFVVISV